MTKTIAPTIGHNSGFAAEQLVSLAERIERCEDEIQVAKEDLKEVYGEAKSHGFDTAILRKVMRMRKRSTADLQEEEAVIDLYMGVLNKHDRDEVEESDRNAV